ncbi:MAG TPA: glycosyltransferase family 1 protein [Patescibacteria group bacterium]|nr:glycosyltransferase family 1 protein [Patescibacteria group bacterium]
MIIGIDGNEANVKNRVGVNMYAFKLIWNLWKLQGEWESRHRLIVYLKNEPLPDLPKETQNFKYKIVSGGGLWIVTKLIPNLFFSRPMPDIFFSPSHYVPFLSPTPTICSIMDLGYLEYTGQFTKKDFWQLKLWTAISIFVSKSIIAISNSTKNEIVRHYPFSNNKIYITHLASDISERDMNISPADVRRIKNRYSIVDDYVLYIGTLKPSKNIEGLIEAFSKINIPSSKIQLVIAGKKGWLYETIIEKVKSLKLEDKVIFTDYISEEDKSILRKGAKVFVQPSFWEGFGIDTLSAMAVGVPVVASNAGSLPEVVGNAGILVDPYNTDSIAGGIKEVLLASTSKYNSMVKAGEAQANKFSWEKCARETLKILEASQR